MKLRDIPLGFFVVLVCGVLAVPLAAQDYRAPDLPADAPPEAVQFDFLLGKWLCTTASMKPDGSMVDGPDALWTGSRILGGWAIEDVWQSPASGAAPSFGVNIRSFNSQTGKWDNRWLPSGSLQWTYFEAEKVGDTMVMTGGESVDGAGRSFIDRNTFHDITAVSWSWRKDRSYDGGESWIEGVARIEARRAAN